jgi:hypothetical protein
MRAAPERQERLTNDHSLPRQECILIDQDQYQWFTNPVITYEH